MVTLNRLTPCSKINILAPRWKDRTVLIADWKVGMHNDIEITAARKSDGERFFPHHFYMSGEQIRKYTTQAHSVRKVYIIPINDLELLERNQ